MTKIIICKVCGEKKQHEAKGMCSRCYNNQCVRPIITCVICCEQKEHHAKGMCKDCYSIEYDRKNREKRLEYYRQHSKEISEYRKVKYANLPTSGGSKTNKECAQYLGVHIAERVLKHVFNDVEVMGMNNPGFDFICNKGKKIDVKSSCRHKYDKKSDSWSFHINYNITPNYFLCIAFDNRNDINIEHLWLIPGEDINNKLGIVITESRLNKWKQYELNEKLDEVIICCDTLKQI